MTDLEIFHNAPESAAPEELAAYLDEACGGDETLRERVEALFAMEEPNDDFLSEAPVPEMEEPVTTGQRPWEPPSVARLQEMLPQYRITGIVGRGGMGAVYRGSQEKLGRDVAIKILPETLNAEGDRHDFAKRFEQEARAMANLDHPAIVSVYDFGETDGGQLYFVMEYIDGMDIHEYLQFHGGTLEQSHAVAITAHVLDALDYAHAHGIVHRDIKPANVLLNNDGRVKIADFGLAKKLEGARRDTPLDSMDGAVTMTNVAVGTPDYLAPEATDPDLPLDHRADLYAVGVMLYKMLTGKLPRGNYKDPSKLRRELDPRLDKVVERLLEPDPMDRYQNASEVRWALEPVFNQHIPRIDPALDESDAQAVVAPEVAVVRKEGSLPSKQAAPRYAGRLSRKSHHKRSPSMSGTFLGVLALVLTLGAFFAWNSYRSHTPPSFQDLTEITPKTKLNPQADATPSDANASSEENTGKASDSLLPKSNAKGTATESADSSPPPNIESPPKPTSTSPQASLPKPPPDTKSDSSMGSHLPPKSSPGSPFASLTGVQERLGNYLEARSSRVEDLTTKYLRGLEVYQERAADSGDLDQVNAFDEEKERAQDLLVSLSASTHPPEIAVQESIGMPPLPESSPPSLTELRETWNDELQKIRSDLDPKLLQSLEIEERNLTKSRSFEKARMLQAYREGLFPALASRPDKTERATAKNFSTTTPKSLSSRPDLANASAATPYVNSLRMKFVPVPITGKGKHHRTILFSIWETRVNDYREFLREETRDWPRPNPEFESIMGQGRDHPAVNVSWSDAVAFCSWLTNKEKEEGKLGPDERYRLPTDHEWSCAVGIGNDEDPDATPREKNRGLADVFPWGSSWPPPKGSGNFYGEELSQIVGGDRPPIENYSDRFPGTSPVGSFEPNPYGIFDLAGNVKEWCDDWNDPSRRKERVLRSSSWFTSVPANIRSSVRYTYAPGMRHDFSGFRVVLEVSQDNTPVAPPIKKTAPLAAPKTVTPATTRPKPGTIVTLTDLEQATREKPFVNSLGMRFVPVPEIEVLFCIHETRWKDYAEFAEENPDIDPEWENQKLQKTGNLTNPDDHPVGRVCRSDAIQFCAWLSKVENKTYRLPKDREWSYAVGIGEQEVWASDTTPRTVKVMANTFPWGTAWPPPKGVGNFHSGFFSEDPDSADPFPSTSPVMSFPPNALGIYDLAGNVIEIMDELSEEEQIMRGGSFASASKAAATSSQRRFMAPGKRAPHYGFRIVLEKPK